MIPLRFEPVLAELRPLGEIFSKANFRLYVVGGTVRDLLLDRATEALDFDLTTDATPQEIKNLLAGWADAVWTAGERFGTISCQKNGRTYEITTHRAEAYSPDSRKPDVEFSTDITTDLSRRDFTINAMALELTTENPVLVDPFGGATDLVSRVLRDRKSTRLNSSHTDISRMPSSA